MEEKKQKLDYEKFYKTFRILGDILFVPFFIIILTSSILMFRAKLDNEVPSLFGYSAVKILTSSMLPNYKQGQVVIVKRIDTKTLKEGDIIAFYEYYEDNPNDDDIETNYDSVNGSTSSENQDTTINEFLGGSTNRVPNYSRVIFHRIVAIKTQTNKTDTANYGKLFFQTRGDAVSSADIHWIMQDYVVGVMSSDNAFVGWFFQFCSSTVGMIVLVIVPSLIILGMLSIDVVAEIKKFKLEKQQTENSEISDKAILDEITGDKTKSPDGKDSTKLEKQKQAIIDDIMNEAKSKAGTINENAQKVKPHIQPKLPGKQPADNVSQSFVTKKQQSTDERLKEAIPVRPNETIAKPKPNIPPPPKKVVPPVRPNIKK